MNNCGGALSVHLFTHALAPHGIVLQCEKVVAANVAKHISQATLTPKGPTEDF